jgi:hypothetical protein
MLRGELLMALAHGQRLGGLSETSGRGLRISRNPWFAPRAESASLSGSPQSIPGYIVGFGGELRLTWIKLENAADEMVV